MQASFGKCIDQLQSQLEEERKMAAASVLLGLAESAHRTPERTAALDEETSNEETSVSTPCSTSTHDDDDSDDTTMPSVVDSNDGDDTLLAADSVLEPSVDDERQALTMECDNLRRENYELRTQLNRGSLK